MIIRFGKPIPISGTSPAWDRLLRVPALWDPAGGGATGLNAGPSPGPSRRGILPGSGIIPASARSKLPGPAPGRRRRVTSDRTIHCRQSPEAKDGRQSRASGRSASVRRGGASHPAVGLEPERCRTKPDSQDYRALRSVTPTARQLVSLSQVYWNQPDRGPR